MTSTNFHAGPRLAPPAEVSTSATEAGGLSAPTMTDEQLAVMAVEATAAPTLTPPTEAEVAVEAGVPLEAPDGQCSTPTGPLF
jgi:hypothetical protein